MSHQIAGWSGQVVADGAGLKVALLRDPATGLYANASKPLVWHSAEEINAFEARGLLTRCEMHSDAVDDGVVAYATKEFIGGTDDRLRLDPGPLVFYLIGSALGFAGYLRRDEARALLRTWGIALLDDAKDQLASELGDEDRRLAAARVMDDARRARFCVSAREDNQLRYEMFKLMAAAAHILHQPVEPIYADASIDIAPARIAALKGEAKELAFRFHRTRASAHRDESLSTRSTDRRLSPIGRAGHGARGLVLAVE